MATPAAAISSSAWWTMPPYVSKTSLRWWETEVAGVMGYMAASSSPAATAPMAAAWFPFITTLGLSSGVAGTSKRKSRLSAAQAYPSSSSATFLS